MDIPRRTNWLSRWSRRAIWGVPVAVVVAAIGIGIGRLEARARTVDAGSILVGTVTRGTWTQEVRGSGVLAPEYVRWVTTSTDGRVERVCAEPGASVRPDTVLIEMSNPQVDQAVLEAEWKVQSAEAELTTERTQKENEVLDREEAAAQASADYEELRLNAEINRRLHGDGLVADRELHLSEKRAELRKRTSDIAQARATNLRASLEARLATAKAKCEQARGELAVKRRQQDALKVRAGADGVLQAISAELGQQLAANAAIAKITRPDKLKATVRVVDSDARDVAVGQAAILDLRGQTMRGKIVRMDPAAQQGSVIVDVGIVDPLPKGARPDLQVFATIEVGRVDKALYVERPVGVRADMSSSVFRIGGDGKARRVAVQFGPASVATITVLNGLEVGDRVIVSDTSNWSSDDQLYIR